MANELQLASTIIPHLRTQFSRGTAVLFTGAGFSLGAVNLAGNTLPSANSLTRQLWELCYPGEEFDDTTQLQDIFDAALQADRSGIERLMRHCFTVDPRRCPEYYARLLGMPWLRIYTLNVDDLAEKVIEHHGHGRQANSISGTTGSIADACGGSLPIIHLNGSLDDLPANVTFGRAQYSVRGVPEAFYGQLRHDLICRPVVFIGSNLEEGPMWQHLALRGFGPKRGEGELRPRSYLITPSLNKSKQALLSRYKIEWLEMDTEQFVKNVLDGMQAERAAGNALLARRFTEQRESGPRILRVADIPLGNPEPTEYLLGAEPEWRDAKHNRIARRECFNEIAREIARIRSSSTVRQFLVVTGTAGTGKSSALMISALQLEAEGIPAGWIDCSDRFDVFAFRNSLQREEGLGALFIVNADIVDRRLSRMVRDALDFNSRMIIVCECRSSKVERVVDRVELRDIEPIEYTIPYLGDSDIDAILEVLDRENRLGLLKGMSRELRRSVFQAEAGRQLLVAMYKATHGVEFRERAVTELRELGGTQKLLYGLISVAHAYRLYLTKDEIGIACGDDVEEWPRALDALSRRKVVLLVRDDLYKARHREIAQFVYDELTREGTIVDVVRALIKIAGTKMGVHLPRTTRAGRMLSTFISHQLVKRTAGPVIGRDIYAEFEQLLSWDYHYWLHRGALELETGNLGVAQNFLNQAKSIEPNDIFVDNELAYLSFRKANDSPLAPSSQQLVDDAVQTLTAVAIRRPDQRARAYHIMGSQGLVWAQRARMSVTEKQRFLGMLLSNVRSALSSDDEDMMAPLERELQRELLSLAIR